MGGGYPSQVQMGGTPARSSQGSTPPRVPPQSDLARGYPFWGYPTLDTLIRPGGGTPAGVPHIKYPHQTLLAIRPRGYPTSGIAPHPQSDLAGGGGGAGAPPRVTDGVLDTPRSVCLLRSCRRIFLFVH